MILTASQMMTRASHKLLTSFTACSGTTAAQRTRTRRTACACLRGVHRSKRTRARPNRTLAKRVSSANARAMRATWALPVHGRQGRVLRHVLFNLNLNKLRPGATHSTRAPTENLDGIWLAVLDEVEVKFWMRVVVCFWAFQAVPHKHLRVRSRSDIEFQQRLLPFQPGQATARARKTQKARARALAGGQFSPQSHPEVEACIHTLS